MFAQFIQDGNSIDYTPTVDTPAGTVVVIGDRVGITKTDIAANTLGSLAMSGVFDIEKDNLVIPMFSKVYWDEAAKKATLTASDNILLGLAIHEAVATDGIVRARIS